MTPQVRYRLMGDGDAEPISLLVRRTFLRFIARSYRRRGIRWFLRRNRPRALRARLRAGQLVLVAEIGERRVGVVAVRAGSHISLLFVDPELHGRGIGRGLVREALGRRPERAAGRRRVRPVEGRGGAQGDRGPDTMTVNSSDFAVPFYRSLGFEPAGAARFEKGMKITPMRRPIRSSRGQSAP